MKTATTKRGLPRQRVAGGASVDDRLALHRRVKRKTGCWEWTASLDQSGYGRIFYQGKLGYAHRLSYEEYVGPIPTGLHIDHLCRNRSCFNPAHLEVVTPQENVLRGMSPGAKALRRDDCLHGHPYEIWGVSRHARRICRLCRIVYMRAYKAMTYGEVAERKDAGLPVVDLGRIFGSKSQSLRLGVPDLILNVEDSHEVSAA